MVEEKDLTIQQNVTPSLQGLCIKHKKLKKQGI